MDDDRIHRAISDDGTEIAARVQGEGPPLVCLHAGLGDGEVDWQAAVPWLRDRFTCHLMSYRGRGLSASNPDRSPNRLVQDVVAYAEILGGPLGLVGPSGGGMFVLAAAARTSVVSAVAVYEPIVFEVLSEDEGAGFQRALEHMAGLSGEGRLVEAARDWIGFFAADHEMVALSASGYFEESAPYVPVLLEEIEHALASKEPGPTDPSILSEIAAPVLILQGSRSTLDWYRDGVRHVADHVPETTVRELPGSGHFGVWVEPRKVAHELTRFFQAVPAFT